MSYPEGSRNAARFVPRVGAEIAGKYRIESKLGEGGMGVVVAARHLTHGGRVALKFLVPGEGERQDAVTRLLREAQSVVRIKSDHVAKVLDVGTLENGDPYIVMELLEGADLNKVVRQRGPLPIPEAVEFVLQAAEAVAEAHGCGIVHRDLKPANLFLTQRPDGSPFVKVLDFGIAKNLRQGNEMAEVSLTVGGDVLGSPLYMSPEQIRNPKSVDPRADVWSLGTILYKLVTGRAAFEADNPSASLAMIIAEEPTPMSHLRPDVPPALEAVVMRCLDKRLDRRYQSVDELACALLPFAPQRARGRPWVATTMTGMQAAAMSPADRASASFTSHTALMPLPASTTGVAMPIAAVAGEMTARTKRRSAAIVAAVAAFLVLLGGLLVLGFRSGQPAEPSVAEPPAAPPQPALPQLAASVAEPVVSSAVPAVAAPLASSAEPTKTAPKPNPMPPTKRPTDNAALDDRL
jgi:serine/threonine-protein kinase